ncbi:MAG: methyltransferase domain-containing protein [Alphaproteobacteria bacterium]|nr:methyltransferase domain-containing protein [Alphaproteobacteria bacterium]
MKRNDFDALLEILKENVGWSFSDKDIYVISNKIDNLIRRKGIPSIEYLVAELKKNESKTFLWQIIESLSISNTSFRRDYKAFKGFIDKVLPYLFKVNNKTKTLNVLSIGCSTGQELYSMAISIKNIIRDSSWKIRLIGLDISSDSIVKAQKGYYSHFEIQQGLSAKDIIENFRFDGNNWQANPELLNMVEFRRFNIFKDDLGDYKFNLILCRNVLNIFEPMSQLDILRKIYRHQTDDAFLCLGLGEKIVGLEEFYAEVPGVECFYFSKSLSKVKENILDLELEEEGMPSFKKPSIPQL